MKAIIQTATLFALVVSLFMPGGALAQPPAPPVPLLGQMLDMWTFANTNFLSFRRIAPLTLTNVASVPTWDGNGLQVDAGDPASIVYPMVTLNGHVELSCSNGSVEFWISPDWNSSDGLGDWATVLEVGTWNTNLYAATGAWGLYISPDGSNLFFSAQTNGASTNYLTTPIAWNAGDWHQIVLTYSVTNSALYLDGELATNGPGMSIIPGADVLTNGFSVGSDGLGTGLLQARAIFNQLITYNYELGADTISNNYAFDSELIGSVSSGGFHMNILSPPDPPGGGTNSGGGVTFNSPNYSASDFWLEPLSPGTNAYNTNETNLTFLLHGTVADAGYQLLSTTNLQLTGTVWVVEQTAYGSEITNFTPMIIPLGNEPHKWFKAFALTVDSDGDGLPDWWEQMYSTTSFPLSFTNADTGNTGILDGYKMDSAGDGYNNLQKYQMGIAPGVPVTPSAPNGFTAILYTNGNLVLSWNAAANLPGSGAGAVTGYTILSDSGSNVTVSASTTNYTFNFSSDYAFNYPPYEMPTYSLQINYAHTNSAQVSTLSYTGTIEEFAANTNLSMETYIVRGPGGRLILIAPNIPKTVAAIRVYANDILNGTNYFFDVPVSSITNGTYVIENSRSQIPFYANYFNEGYGYEWVTQPIGKDGSFGETPPDMPFGVAWALRAVPFLDGTVQLQQNVSFLLEAANETNALSYSQKNGLGLGIPHWSPTNYVYSGFYQEFDYTFGLSTGINEFQPFIENANYRNFVFSVADLNSDGSPNTGAYIDAYDTYDASTGLYYTLPILPPTPKYAFDFNAFISTGSTNTPSPLLTNLDWTAVPQVDGIAAIDLTEDTSGWPYQFTMGSGVANYFGLTYESTKISHSDAGGNLGFTTISPGSTFIAATNYTSYSFYPGTAQPSLETVGYYFGRPYIDPLPGESNFVPTNTTPLMLLSVAQLSQWASYRPAFTGWAKEAILNGATNKFAFVEQYFDKAYLADTNGNITTNQTGILSEYGDFFATQPGKTFLVTKTNMLGQRGTNAIYVISLALDANHDGTIDTSFFGPDFTSPAKRFVFWVNNDYDRNFFDNEDTTNYEDSVLGADCPYTPGQDTRDNNYRDASGRRVIPTKRDLQDFTRLWLAGITTNLLTNLPSGSKITLSWGDVGSPNTNNPVIDLFAAADADGGMGYLTNETICIQQTNISLCPYIGRLGPGQSIQLNASTFSNSWAGNHFIWCGEGYGNGVLMLTIPDAGGNVLAQTAAYIQIVDMKQMYERWTVGESLSAAPTNTARLAEDNFPPGLFPAPFKYDPATDTNTPYILYVHGWNMSPYDKDRFAETAFKRLYWQGYQGRFGVFRWPTGYGFKGLESLVNDLNERHNYDSSEFNAWKSGGGLLNKLEDLNAQYPGNVYLLAHSMGNVVAGEALRLSSSRVVNTYVASQGAISAHTYDTNVPDYSFTFGIGSLGPDTPNIYGDWFAGNNGGGAGKVVNFYNTNDYALARSHWQLNQLLKPDYSVLEGTNTWTYSYTGSPTDGSPWNNFIKTSSAGTTGFFITTSLNDRYEVMAYAAESYTTALGATSVVTNLASLDLTTKWPPDNSTTDSTKKFGEHFYHSAEFRGDCASEWQYWNTLLYSSGLGFDISNP